MFKCDHCDYRANLRTSIVRHIEIVHKLIRYPCKECPFRAHQKAHLLEHVEAIHEGVIYQCDYCDHKSKTQIDLWKHHQTHHCNDQNHQVELKDETTFEEFLCFYCEISIQNREVLEMHRSECFKIPLTNYPCDKCGLQCPSEEQLEVHKRSYHVKDIFQNESGQSNNENVKLCDFCGIKFGTLGGLRSHIRSRHKEMLPI